MAFTERGFSSASASMASMPQEGAPGIGLSRCFIFMLAIFLRLATPRWPLRWRALAFRVLGILCSFLAILSLASRLPSRMAAAYRLHAFGTRDGAVIADTSIRAHRRGDAGTSRRSQRLSYCAPRVRADGRRGPVTGFSAAMMTSLIFQPACSRRALQRCDGLFAR